MPKIVETAQNMAKSVYLEGEELMKYCKSKKYLEIFDKADFDIAQILECGQIFSYHKDGEVWNVFSKDKRAKVTEAKNGYKIETDDVDYFENFFDLKTDYGKVKQYLKSYDIMKEPIKRGGGIRILKQDLFETLISFIVSANNNIKRIKVILQRIREKFGSKMDGYFAFPTRKQLLRATENDFVALGAGYRAKYLHNVLREVDETILQEWQCLSTEDLRKKLISLSGVGPKVADCVMLFGYARTDVFPVDTWMAQMYNKHYQKQDNRLKISRLLVEEFGEFSGYAQQYLFFKMIGK